MSSHSDRNSDDIVKPEVDDGHLSFATSTPLLKLVWLLTFIILDDIIFPYISYSLNKDMSIAFKKEECSVLKKNILWMKTIHYPNT